MTLEADLPSQESVSDIILAYKRAKQIGRTASAGPGRPGAATRSGILGSGAGKVGTLASSLTGSDA